MFMLLEIVWYMEQESFSVGGSQDMVFLTLLLDKGNTVGKKISPHSQIYYFLSSYALGHFLEKWKMLLL